MKLANKKSLLSIAILFALISVLLGGCNARSKYEDLSFQSEILEKGIRELLNKHAKGKTIFIFLKSIDEKNIAPSQSLIDFAEAEGARVVSRKDVIFPSITGGETRCKLQNGETVYEFYAIIIKESSRKFLIKAGYDCGPLSGGGGEFRAIFSKGKLQEWKILSFFRS